MDYVKLGSTGLEVSRICLGCMSFGEPERGNQPWSLGEDDARVIIRRALEAGINFLDTANVYSDGSSEEIVGRALADFSSRDEIVLATKVHGRMRPGPNGGGLSRKAIMSEIDKSLTRLGTDYVDLYQIHRFDPTTPVEETVEALHDVVKSGKARYIGASSMYAWQFAKMLHVARAERLDPVRLDARSLQPPLSRRRARDAAVVPGRRHWRHSLESARARPARHAIGMTSPSAAPSTSSASSCTPSATGQLSRKWRRLPPSAA